MGLQFSLIFEDRTGATAAEVEKEIIILDKLYVKLVKAQRENAETSWKHAADVMRNEKIIEDADRFLRSKKTPKDDAGLEKKELERAKARVDAYNAKLELESARTRLKIIEEEAAWIDRDLTANRANLRKLEEDLHNITVAEKRRKRSLPREDSDELHYCPLVWD